MPVIVSFDVAVKDKANIEKHLRVTSTPKQPGAWHWISDHEVHWRPKSYWRAGTDVSVDVDINSVPAGAGIFGQEDRHVEFHVGDANIYKVNAQTHQMQVFSNGALLRTIPITTGKPGFTTRSGVKVIIEKFREKADELRDRRHRPERSRALRHRRRRVRHAGHLFRRVHPRRPLVGRLAGLRQRLPRLHRDEPANAGWLYKITKRGDVVEYTGTDRPMESTNGYGDWNIPFPRTPKAQHSPDRCAVAVLPVELRLARTGADTKAQLNGSQGATQPVSYSSASS